MKKRVVRRWAWLSGLVTVGSLCAAGGIKAQEPYVTPQKPSITESISSSVKQGVDKVGDAITPKPAPKPSEDPVSLESKAKPGPGLYVALARLHEQKGDLPQAEAQYKKALQESPNELRALLGYARLKERLGEHQEVMKLYQRAMKAHPKEASVHNNMAVYYARRGMLREAVGSLERAVQLKPKEVKYRNNLATMLVETGRYQEAYNHLRAVHDEATAHYNLGYLMNKRGERQAAIQQFAIAVQINPSMAQARQWIDHLSGGTGQPSMMAQRPGVPGAGEGGPREQPRVAANPYPVPGVYAPPSVPPSPRESRAPVARQIPPPPDSGSEAVSRPVPGVETPRRLPPTSQITPPPRRGPEEDDSVAPLPPGMK